MPHINLSWREQRKAVAANDGEGHDYEWISVWAAARDISDNLGCRHETAKKEIRKAIKTGCPRYGLHWYWK